MFQSILTYLHKMVNLLFQNGQRLARVEEKLDTLLELLNPLNTRVVRLVFDAIFDGEIKEGVTSMTFTDSQQFIATIKPVNKKGQPAPVEAGSVIWTAPSFVALTPSADGLSVTVVAMGLGTGDLSVSADADLGAGVVTISGTLALEVIPSQAVSVGIEAGQPTEQDAAGPEPNA